MDNLSDLDNMVVIPNGDGDDPQIVVVDRDPSKTCSTSWVNFDGTISSWTRPDGYTGPPPKSPWDGLSPAARDAAAAAIDWDAVRQLADPDGKLNR